MDKKKEFNEALAELVEFATVSANIVTVEQVKMYFKDIIEDEGKYPAIYAYLKEMKIKIEGLDEDENAFVDSISKNNSDSVAVTVENDVEQSESEEESEENRVNANDDVKKSSQNSSKNQAKSSKEETDEAKKFYGMYLSDVESVRADIDEKRGLLSALVAGDSDAKARLTESYLDLAIEVAGEYNDAPLLHSDLVAEANLALFEAISSYKGNDNLEEFEKLLKEKIRFGIEKATYEELGSERISNHLVQRINALNDASTDMAKELGREASLEELSERLSLSPDEIKELMKISIDALTVNEE